MIYLASSWRNKHFDTIADCFENCNIPIYNFKDQAGFHWSEIDPNWECWSRGAYVDMLDDPEAERGFARDFNMLAGCDGLLLITPCGRSAHLELGYVIGRKKPTCIYLTEDQEPELMYKLADRIVTEITQVMEWASNVHLDAAHGLQR